MVCRSRPEWIPAGRRPGGAAGAAARTDGCAPCASSAREFCATNAINTTTTRIVDFIRTSLMADVGAERQVLRLVVLARIAFRNSDVPIRIKSQLPRSEYPRLQQHFRVFCRDRVVKDVALTAEPLDDMQL